jgi:Fe-S-cluster containining protein
MTIPEIKISKKFEKGIYFSCKMCGECCRGFDEGEVYLYKEDIVRLRNFLNFKRKTSLKKFARDYLKIVSTSFNWRKPGAEKGKTYRIDTLGFKFAGDDEHCVFLGEDNICTVHEARPFQCRAFPIGWNMLINNLYKFKDYSRKCPGLRKSLENEGKFYSREEILKWAHKEYNMEKEFFLELKKKKFDIFKVYTFIPKDITC